MPTAVLKSYAEQSGKTLEEVEKVWASCKAQADSKFSKKDEHYWAYVNSCTKRKLNITSKVSNSKESKKAEVGKKKPLMTDW